MRIHFRKMHMVLLLLCVILLLPGCNTDSKETVGNTGDVGVSRDVANEIKTGESSETEEITKTEETSETTGAKDSLGTTGTEKGTETKETLQETEEPEETPAGKTPQGEAKSEGTSAKESSQGAEKSEKTPAKETPQGEAAAEESSILNASTVGENTNVTYGIDVSKYQGTIDWATVAANGIEFAIIRVGYRGTTAGGFGEDPMAGYNLQEAEKNGVKIGVYFYSTAISKEEAIEEADWVCNIVSDYSVTYPIAIDCEGYGKEGHRQYPLTKAERTDVAMAFMDRIYENGYTPMIYGDVKTFEGDAEWDTSRIEDKYKIWIAWYNQDTSNLENKPAYNGQFAMWQYSNHGHVDGIPAEVDLNVAYFGYDGVENKKGK